MRAPLPYTINVRGRLFDLSEPQVIGILNVTPDSFFEASRQQTEEDIRRRAEQIVAEGGSMIDVGAYSTRPGSAEVSEEEEMSRLRMAMRVVREVAPDIPVSVDTFRSDVARMAIEELGADIVNDVSGGEMDENMFPTVARLGVPYVLTHTMPTENLMPDILYYLSKRVQQLRDLGQKDIIIDPGYGFSKTLEQNYHLLFHQEELLIYDLPILVGVSRKSMIYKRLGCTPAEALNGTTALNTIALTKGTNILRVHDVKECVEIVKLLTDVRCKMSLTLNL